MKRKKFSAEQIVAVLRDAETTSVAGAARKHDVSESTILRWERKSADMVAWLSERHLRKRYLKSQASIDRILSNFGLERVRLMCRRVVRRLRREG